MTSLKFEKCGVDPRTGEVLYRLIIGGRTVREDLTLDQVVEAINRRDEERLGWEHAPRTEEESPTAFGGAPFYPAGHRRQGGQRGE